MKVANIILFHQDRVAIERLISALQHPDFDFYLHLDKKISRDEFATCEALPQTAFIKKRKAVRWAGFSQLEAAVNSLGEILESGKRYDFFNLLSGQDYPIKPVGEITEFLSAHIGHSLLKSESPPSEWWTEASHRYKRYHFEDYGFPGKHRLGETLSNILPERKFPMEVPLYGGPDAAYWTLSETAAIYLYESLKRKDRKAWFFKHTWAPDEFVVNTILMNSEHQPSVINENYRYIDRSLGGAHPKILTVADFGTLKASGKFFARKFDRHIDNDILDMIDRDILASDI